jgi:hypothetical protein
MKSGGTSINEFNNLFPWGATLVGVQPPLDSSDEISEIIKQGSGPPNSSSLLLSPKLFI